MYEEKNLNNIRNDEIVEDIAVVLFLMLRRKLQSQKIWNNFVLFWKIHLAP